MDTHSVSVTGSASDRSLTCSCGWEYRSPFGPQLVAIARLHAMLGAVVVEEIAAA